MVEYRISQAEADILMKMEKCRIDDTRYNYPWLKETISIPLKSKDKREEFILDIRRGGIELKGTYQNRARQVITLVRLDFGGQPHRNPDGMEISGNHLHVYREGYDDKFAVPVPSEFSHLPDDLWGTLEDFMAYCNIIETPIIDRGLFS